jgi:hypothetical protein
MSNRRHAARPSTTRRKPAPPRRRREERDEDLLAQADASLLELVDHVLNRGVMVTGDLMLGLADVDLVYVRLSALLCAADRLLGSRR